MGLNKIQIQFIEEENKLKFGDIAEIIINDVTEENLKTAYLKILEHSLKNENEFVSTLTESDGTLQYEVAKNFVKIFLSEYEIIKTNYQLA